MKNKYFLKHVIGMFVFFTILFLSAGTLNYWQGWVYVTIGLIMFVLNYTVFRIDLQLLNERSKMGVGSKNWDKTIVGLSFIITISMYIIAGLDSGRFNCTTEFHWAVTLFGIILTAVGQVLFLIAQKENKFFSTIVRIQTDRDHYVCMTGLYRFVMHPAYQGSIMQSLGFPLLFGSLWSIIPISLMIILLIIRTELEDKTLRNELKGYQEYCEKTRYKIIPYLW